MKIEYLSKGEKKALLEKLSKQYGINELNLLLFRLGKEKIRGYTGNLSKDEINEINRIANVAGMGLYLANEDVYGIRLSVDAAHVLKEQIKKNVIEIDDEQEKRWMKGENLEVDEKLRGFFIVKNKKYGDFLGCGKASNGRITNFLPKERLIKH